MVEVGSGTRRRPIERDYAAAKDAEVGKSEHNAEGTAHSGLEEGGRQIAAVRFFSLIPFPNRQSHARQNYKG